jgi:hypothetical protein
MAYLVLLGRWPQTPSGQATILVPLGVWVVLRLSLWWHMKLLLSVLEQPELCEALGGGGDPDALCVDDLPLELAPLMRGAWLVGALGPAPAGVHRCGGAPQRLRPSDAACLALHTPLRPAASRPQRPRCSVPSAERHPRHRPAAQAQHGAGRARRRGAAAAAALRAAALLGRRQAALLPAVG